MEMPALELMDLLRSEIYKVIFMAYLRVSTAQVGEVTALDLLFNNHDRVPCLKSW